MKARLLFIIMSAALVGACSPDEFSQYDFSNYTVDKVVCEAGSGYLVTDNVSELDLHVKLYAKVGTYTDKYGKERDRYMEIPETRWRNHDIKYYVNGSQVTPPYKTSSASAGTLKCYAEVDGVRSSQSPAKLLALYQPAGSKSGPATEPDYTPDPDPFYFEVELREPYTPQKRRVAVIFHVIDIQTNITIGHKLEAEVIYHALDMLNDVFNRTNSTAPNGANPNIEFVPAKRNASGVLLPEPGINRYTLSDAKDITAIQDDTEKWLWGAYYDENGIKITESKYNSWVSNGNMPKFTPKVFWDTDKYLNVWVLYGGVKLENVSYPNLTVHYLPMVYPEGVYDPEAFPIPAAWQTEKGLRQLDNETLAVWKKNPHDLRLPPAKFTEKVKSLGQAGIFVRKASLANYSSNLAQQVGAYFGLIPNSLVSWSSTTQYPSKPANTDGSNVWQDDYCDDTPNQNRWFGTNSDGGIESVDIGTARIRYTMEAPYFVFQTTNIMERESSMSYVSQDQVKRMQWVLENAPGRQMWKNTSAID